MPLQPKRVKYRKQHRGRCRGNATSGNEVSFGEFGLQSLERGWITARQIEAARVAANQLLKGGDGRLWIRIFPHKSVTGRPAETRMGKGKGEIEYWCAVVKPGTVMFEVGGVPADAARLALLRATHKLPVRCRFAQRRHKI